MSSKLLYSASKCYDIIKKQPLPGGKGACLKYRHMMFKTCESNLT